MKKRRGFSVFTPMVGTLVILITMLIVTSIITSERIAVQGSVKAYRSSELVNIAGEAQSRVIEEVRSSITSRLEDYSIRGEPVMSHIEGSIEEFLSTRGFTHIEKMESADYKKAYFRGKNASREVSDLAAFAYARIADRS